MRDARMAWLALSAVPKLNAADATHAARQLGGPDKLFDSPAQAAALVHELACSRLGRLGECDAPDTPPPAAFEEIDPATIGQIEARLEAGGARVLWYDHPEYPPLLRHAPDAPLVLFARGSIEPADELSVAVVGSRDATAYGLRIIRPLVEGLVAHGVTIVSGMARGLDAAAHRTALNAGGRTLAVLGTHIDRAYPVTSRDLFREIPEHGCVLSEYAPGHPFRKQHFLERNRIVAGCARALLVIEAGARSGTANTVGHALGYDRPVYAVPGDVTAKRSEGTNRMIVRSIARPVRDAADLLEDLLGYELSRQPTAEPDLDEPQMSVWRALGEHGQVADAIAESTGRSVHEVRPILAMLEVAGLARRTPVGGYARAEVRLGS